MLGCDEEQSKLQMAKLIHNFVYLLTISQLRPCMLLFVRIPKLTVPGGVRRVKFVVVSGEVKFC